jgi:hypothetical protein
MVLKEVLIAALKPHKEKLTNWKEEDLELLFMGFGNISIYWKDEDPREDNNLAGTFQDNAQGILGALDSLDLNKGEWDSSDFYWLISANAGEIRSDLVSAIEEAGFKCYDYYDSEENEIPQSIKVYEAEPSLFRE